MVPSSHCPHDSISLQGGSLSTSTGSSMGEEGISLVWRTEFITTAVFTAITSYRSTDYHSPSTTPTQGFFLSRSRRGQAWKVGKLV